MTFNLRRSFPHGHNNLEKKVYINLHERTNNKTKGTEFLEKNAMNMAEPIISNINLPKNNSIYTNFLKNKLSSQFNINNVKFAYDKEDNQKICIFEVGDISAEEISDLGLKIREEAYNYAKKNNLIDYYNKFVFLVRR
jgi:hypothetical protein